MDEQSRVLTADMIETIRSAAQKMGGYERRQFQAEVALKYCGGSARTAETRLGFSRQAVQTGLSELRTGIRCLDAFQQRGRKKTEVRAPQIETDIRRIVEPVAQADPKFQSNFAYTRITAQAVRTALLEQDPSRSDVPCRQTVGTILNRLGYRLRSVLKSKPQKRSKKPTPSSTTCNNDEPSHAATRRAYEARLTRKRK